MSYRGGGVWWWGFLSNGSDTYTSHGSDTSTHTSHGSDTSTHTDT